MLQLLLCPGRQTLMVCVGEKGLTLHSSHTAKIRKERERRGEGGLGRGRWGVGEGEEGSPNCSS